MNKKQIITERTVIDAWKKGAKTIDVESGSIITPQAKDSAKVKNISFIPKLESGTGRTESYKFQIDSIAIGCDHAGFRLKEVIKRYLVEKNIKIEDFGTHSEDACDYPDFAFAVGMAVKQNKTELGIIIDGTGNASAITANKIPGIRAACCTSEFMARSSREHNNANILTLGSKVIGEELAKSMVDAFLSAQFLEGRHLKRLEKVRDIENKFLR
jgi:ribose 5-phosphate isomerase B